MEIKEADNKFVKVVPSKEKIWINDVYYGTKGLQQKGHLIASGNLVFEGAYVENETITGLKVEEPLYHRNAKGEVLLDTGIKR